MASDVEWVEIRCPRTGEPLFANLDTGECLWEAPLGATVRAANVNQWWELYDSNSHKNYYHNSSTGETVWKKPRGAEILPLTKLQAKSGPEKNHARNGTMGRPTETRPDTMRTTPNKTPSDSLYREEVLSVSTTATLDRNSLNSNPPPISPYAVKPTIHHNNHHQQSMKPNKHGKLPPPIATKPASLKRPVRNAAVNSTVGARTLGEDTPGSTTETTHTRTDTHTDKAADDPPPLTAVKQVESSADTSHADNSSASDPMNQYLNPSRNLSTTRRSIENLSNIDSDSEQIPDIPAHPNHDHTENNSVRNNIEKLKQNRHEQRFSSFHDYSAPVKYSASTPSDPRNQTLPGKENEEHLTPSMEEDEVVSPVKIEVDDARDGDDADDEEEGELVECDGCFLEDQEDSLLFEDSSGTVFQWRLKKGDTRTDNPSTLTLTYENIRPTKLQLSPENKPDNLTTPDYNSDYNIDYNIDLPDPPAFLQSSPFYQNIQSPDVYCEVYTPSQTYPTTTNTDPPGDRYVNIGGRQSRDCSGDGVYSVANSGRRSVVSHTDSNSPDSVRETSFGGSGREGGYSASNGRNSFDEGARQHSYSDYVNIESVMFQCQDTNEQDSCSLQGGASYVNWSLSRNHVTSSQPRTALSPHFDRPLPPTTQPNFSALREPETPETPYVNWPINQDKWRIIGESHKQAQSSSFQHIEGQIKSIYEELYINDTDCPSPFLKSSSAYIEPLTENSEPATDSGTAYAEVVLRENKSARANKDKRRSNSMPHGWTPGRSSSIYSQGAYTEVKILPPKPSEIDNIEFNESEYRGSRDLEQQTRSRLFSNISLSDTDLSPKPVSRSRRMVGSLRRAGSGLRVSGSLRRKNPNVFERLRNLTKRFSASENDLTSIGNSSERRHSAELSPAPNKDKKGSKKPPVTRSPTSPIPKLPKEKEFVKKNINRPRGFIKKVSIATMLAHSKDQIKKPIILTQDKEVRKDAVVWFKNLQEYMGDTKVGKGLKDKERLKRAAEITYTGWQKVCFRDEFFMQVIKQTTCNSKPKSLEWGWKLISAYLYYFPPTIRFQGYLEGYLYKNKENDLNQCEVPVQVYADYCYDRLAKMITRGAKHGQKKPTDDDIAHAMQLPFKKSMFGATLDEVMDLQKESHPNHHLPWVLTLLAEKVVLYGGYSTEGIFRVPGDIDKVCSLKVSLDNGEHIAEFPTTDAPVCASLLKEWLRELYDPAICHDTYQKCLDNCENAAYCSTIVSELPDINRLVVTFVIKFLQGFLAEETIKKTKMTADNLAMVFAPNLLRCPSTDLQVAMDNSKWEMTFVRTLINNLDTSYMDGVV